MGQSVRLARFVITRNPTRARRGGGGVFFLRFSSSLFDRVAVDDRVVRPYDVACSVPLAFRPFAVRSPIIPQDFFFPLAICKSHHFFHRSQRTVVPLFPILSIHSKVFEYLMWEGGRTFFFLSYLEGLNSIRTFPITRTTLIE